MTALTSRLATVRSGARRALRASLGGGAETAAHTVYHRFLRLAGRFEPPEDAESLAGLAALARGARTVVDVGANAGRYALYFRRHAPAGTTVYALEPNPAAAALLRLNTAAAGVTCLELALGERDGDGVLAVPVDRLGSAVSGLGRLDGTSGGTETHRVLVRRLDSLVAEGVLRLEPPLLLKIDVEGDEAAVLAGAAVQIERYRPAIYFECEQDRAATDDPATLWRRLAGWGYAVLGREGAGFRVHTEPRAGVSNYLGLAPESDWSALLRDLTRPERARVAVSKPSPPTREEVG